MIKQRKRESISSIDNNICSPNRNDFNEQDEEKQKYQDSFMNGDCHMKAQDSPLNKQNGINFGQ